MTRTLAIAILACCSVWAQSPAFEVASVKPAAPLTGNGGRGFFRPFRMDGGPGTADPTRIDFRLNLSNLITRAYSLSYWQLSGPEWMEAEHYDVRAKVPPETTKEQFNLMLQNLLAERFKLQVHRETKELSVYSLVVAKGGSKLKPHVDSAAAVKSADPSEADGPARLKTDPDGYPVLTGGMTMAMTNGRARLRDANKELAWLVGQLSGQLAAPVIDDTGLKGSYDFSLFWSMRRPSETENGPDLIEAVQQQLGLRLEKKKGPVEMLVVDHAEKVPVGN